MDTEQSRLYGETKPMRFDARQAAHIRTVLERRTKTFLAAVESECQVRSPRDPEGESKPIGVSVFSWEEE